MNSSFATVMFDDHDNASIRHKLNKANYVDDCNWHNNCYTNTNSGEVSFGLPASCSSMSPCSNRLRTNTDLLATNAEQARPTYG